ncbi:MAG: GNAT family N-acetyltransferase [Lachnospiraceae bacterium]|nr:GNAT family N-acetyltransferase [Lachnospiraceae bacterium]
MRIRNATNKDLPAVAAIYDEIHTEEENGRACTGWIRGIYPTADTAKCALQREDLFVQEENGEIVGAAIINQQQVDVYRDGHWEYEVPDRDVMVLHTLVISPKASQKGYGRKFAAFYEQYALSHGCHFLRIDTNAINQPARALYKKLGYHEVGIVPTVFNGIEGVQLVLLEKNLR